MKWKRKRREGLFDRITRGLALRRSTFDVSGKLNEGLLDVLGVLGTGLHDGDAQVVRKFLFPINTNRIIIKKKIKRRKETLK